MPFLRSFSIDADKKSPFPFDIPAVKFAKQVKLDERVTIFVGDNGSGKSTLLETLALWMDVPLIGGYISGSKGFDAARQLQPFLTVESGRSTKKGFFFRAEDFSSFVDAVERGRITAMIELAELGGKVPDSIIEKLGSSMNFKLSTMIRAYGSDMQAYSHGEAYLTILQKQMRDKGVYFLDEPEAALSPLKQLSLMALIMEMLKNRDTQFIIATHSPILMGLPDATIYEIREEGMSAVGYKDTDHYRITKTFLDNPEYYLRYFR